MSDPGREASVRRDYDLVADAFAAMLPDTRAETAQDLAMIDRFVSLVGVGGKVLDAGCGAGRISRHLADRGVEVVGVDLSPGMVLAARRAHPDLTFGAASIAALPVRDAAFDAVILWYSTIHTPPESQARIYREARRVLRPGGHLLVGFQAGVGVHDTSASYARHGFEVSLVRYRFTADQVSGWMAAAGLREVDRLERDAEGKEIDAQAVVLAVRGD